MKRQKSCGPRLGKLVHQLPGVVTFAYDLCFRRVIARWKGIIEEIHFGGSIMPLDIIENLDLKKPSFRPSKWPRKLKPAKNSKLPKLPENCFEPVGKGGWPPISTWIKAPRSCYARMDNYLTRLGFSKSHVDPNLYYKVMDNAPIILLLYVDNLFITGEESLIIQCKKELAYEFDMKDLGLMNYYLGLEVWQKHGEVFLRQGK
jgi:hypothetical protein